MALFSFGKKKEMQQPIVQQPTGPPTDTVLSMREQGLSNNQIVQSLYRQGYQPSDVFDAMNQANVKESVENIAPDYFNQQYPGQQPMQQPAQQPMQQQPMQDMQQPTMQDMQQGYQQQGFDQGGVERIEEVAEAIINEKWSEVVKSLNKITEWKEKTESRVAVIEQGFNDLKQSFDKLHEAILGKIGEYDQNIVNLGTEIKAMEKVFQKVLPALTDNVNELSRITDGMKKKS